MYPDIATFKIRQDDVKYSRVPNKRGGGENNREGLKWFDVTIIGGLE